MTMQTACFMWDKEKGAVRRTGLTGGFHDGRTYHERRLWYNSSDNRWYVIFQKEAFVFKWYDTLEQNDRDVIRGYI